MDYSGNTDLATAGVGTAFSAVFSVLCCGVYVIPIIFGLIVLVLWIIMLIRVIQRPDSSFKNENDRLIWILIVLLASWIGAIVYYFVEDRPYQQSRKK
jgi:uncharacterized BrkB/YihY/UPF0761 family membrane protein